jgi:hypothetical protein
MAKVNIKRVLALLSLSLLLAASAAGQRRKAAAAAPLDYFPLQKGYSWTYRHSEGSEFTMKVISEEKQPDNSVRYLVELNAGAVIRYSYSKPKGWVLLHHTDYTEQQNLTMDFEPAKQYLKNPLVAGASWSWAGKDVTGIKASESSKVIGLEWVEVPAGRFRAMKIVSQVSNGGALLTKTYWYVAGVGCVKSSTEAGETKYGYELIDYSFKAPPGKLP